MQQSYHVFSVSLRLEGCLHDAQDVGEVGIVGERANGGVSTLARVLEGAEDGENADKSVEFGGVLAKQPSLSQPSIKF
jgi:hypothetical protein